MEQKCGGFMRRKQQEKKMKKEHHENVYLFSNETGTKFERCFRSNL